MDPKLHIAYNILPVSMVEAAVDAILDTPLGDMEETTHPFEPKISVPKSRYSEKWALDILYECYRGFSFSMQTYDAYFTRFYVHRTGDYLQRHIDPALHGEYRKVRTLLIYLTDCDGGELTIFGQEIQPRPNMAVLFLNSDDSFHSVKPIRQGPRVVFTMAQIVPVEAQFDSIQRTNTRAVFTPEPGEVWTDEQYILAAR